MSTKLMGSRTTVLVPARFGFGFGSVAPSAMATLAAAFAA
eukprot:CAMPEP_0202848478 /NCGR_PEP_ID=MMETSP1389-20130828/78230_1 /ASSEMBLY_ACC=CAM_ASM_000865 /TAXON_ID=302021 /ORGANISM="Rhodomonas sp., Strain CCMP768" /LENGTH=39 /DNA_ID= /DNA_START= /DNA_END= /DNA_ORIENTATION=